MKSFYAHNSNYDEWENTVLKYMDENDFDELMEFITDKYLTHLIGPKNIIEKFLTLLEKQAVQIVVLAVMF